MYLVSVIIPIYNVELYLRTCLDSVLSQTYSNIEVICINDGSTDMSTEILTEYKNCDKRIKVITIKNSGVSNARNLALKESCGDYVMFVDADDWLEKETIEKLLNHSKFPECDIAMFPYFSEHTNSTAERKLFEKDIVFSGKEKNDLARLLIGPIGSEINNPAKLDSYGTIWGKIYKRRIIEGLSFIDLKIIGTAEDSVFNMHAFKRAKRILYTNIVHYHYRRNNTSSATSKYRPWLVNCWKHQYSIISRSFQSDVEQEALQNRIALNVLGASLNEFSAPNRNKSIRLLLNDFIYHEALKNLTVRYLPFHWKVFYSCARYKQNVLLMFLIMAIKKILSRK